MSYKQVYDNENIVVGEEDKFYTCSFDSCFIDTSQIKHESPVFFNCVFVGCQLTFKESHHFGSVILAKKISAIS